MKCSIYTAETTHIILAFKQFKHIEHLSTPKLEHQHIHQLPKHHQ